MTPSGTPGATAPSPVALVLIDFVNPLDFPGADDLAPAALQAARSTAVLLRRARERGIACIHANDNYGIWRSDFEQLRHQCQRKGGIPARMARWLAPVSGDYTVLKPRHSAFYDTPLALLLQQMGTRRLVLTGLAADNCVLFTAMDAFVRGFELWIPEDCTAAEKDEYRLDMLRHARRVMRAETRPAAGDARPGGR